MRRISLNVVAFILSLVFGVTLSSLLLSSHDRTQFKVSDSSLDESVEPGSIPQVKSAAFVGRDKAWLVTWEKFGELWRTEDGGKSWDKISGKAVGGLFCGVSFIDAQRGWAGNFDGQIWRTNDGGSSWVLLSHPEGGDEHDSLICPQQISFIDESHGWVIGAFSIWRTDDGGKSWVRSLSMCRVENVLWQPTHISLANQNVGLVSASGGIVHRTADGGRTWQSQKLISGESDATDVLFINERTSWLAGFVSSTGSDPGTRLYRSNDGGESWQQVPIADDHTYINSVCFISEKEGWSVGRVWLKPGDMRGIVLHTKDGGKSWQETPVGEGEQSFDRMFFVDSEHGWLLGSNNIYRSRNGGKSWESVLKVTPMRISTD